MPDFTKTGRGSPHGADRGAEHGTPCVIQIFNDNGRFTAFDFETTGFDPKKDRIVDIGAVQFDKQGVIKRFSSLINPDMLIPPHASAVNNITNDMVRDARIIDAALPDFLRFIENTSLIAHNAGFDRGFINETLNSRFRKASHECEATGQTASRFASQFASQIAAQRSASGQIASQIAAPQTTTGQTARFVAPFAALPNRVIDTIALAKEAFPGLDSYGLQALSAFFGIPVRDAHRAEDDARVCMEVFLRCVKKLEEAGHDSSVQ